MIHINASEGLIGDSLMCLPFLKQVHAEQPHEAIMLHGGLNQWVRDGLNLPWLLVEPDYHPDAAYTLSASDAFHEAHRGRMHMMQAFFRANRIAPPALGAPCYDIRRDLHPVPRFEAARPYIAIAPFSRTDIGGNKVVPPATWLQFAKACEARGYDVHVLGAPSDVLEGLPTLSGTLPEVVGILQGAHRTFTIDTGTSHIAHMVGLTTHVLVAPKCTHEKHVLNHFGQYVWTHPADLSVDTLLSYL